jgi:hypothetical protein
MLANSAVVDYNPPDVLTAYYWVFFEGDDNRVDRCLFAGKTHMGPLVGNAIKDSRHNAVTGSYFRDIGSSSGRATAWRSSASGATVGTKNSAKTGHSSPSSATSSITRTVKAWRSSR